MNNRILKVFLCAFTAVAVTVLFGFAPLFGENAENVLAELPASAYINVDFEGNTPINAARCAIVIDSESGNVLYSKNADEKRGMASTTKIMTALVAIENCDPETEFLMPKEAVGVEGSSVYLKEGEPLTLRELLYCLMLESGNDAAAAIAICVGGSTEAFAQMMNDRAAEMGLVNTHFANPHGLSDESHRTTARELAIITAEAMKYPLFCEICSAKTMRVRYDGTENGRSLVNHNKLLFSYSGAIGVKTGYTRLDGKCLVSAAERNGMRLIVVTLQDPFPTATHKALLDSAFSDFEKVSIAESGKIKTEIPVNNSENAFLSVENTESVSICLPKGANAEIELVIPESVNAPVESGEIIGYAICRANGIDVYIINLEATESAEEKKKSFFEKIFGK